MWRSFSNDRNSCRSQLPGGIGNFILKDLLVSFASGNIIDEGTGVESHLPRHNINAKDGVFAITVGCGECGADYHIAIAIFLGKYRNRTTARKPRLGDLCNRKIITIWISVILKNNVCIDDAVGLCGRVPVRFGDRRSVVSLDSDSHGGHCSLASRIHDLIGESLYKDLSYRDLGNHSTSIVVHLTSHRIDSHNTTARESGDDGAVVRRCDISNASFQAASSGNSNLADGDDVPNIDVIIIVQDHI